MKIKYFFIVALGIMISSMSYGQNHSFCGTPSPYAPEYANLIDVRHTSDMEDLTNQKMAAKTIPVVVHVLHDNGIGNISDAQIFSAIDQINEDFPRLNADTSDTRQTANAPFKQYAGAMDIEFKLARIDPSGNCTNGIIRKNVGPTGPTYNVNMNSEPHKSTSAGGSSAWPVNKYFNIWVVNSISSSGQGTILAYAEFPTAFSSSTYGVATRHDEFGTTGTANGGGTRTLTHEIGHCFNLIHTFQPGWSGTSGCQAGDQVSDTPPTEDESGFTCNQNQNTCSNVPGGDPWGFDVLDQIENYMSYNSCQNMFSIGQVNRMNNAFNNNSWMNNLASASNAVATGVNSPDALCKAEFEGDKTVVCQGESIQFTDMSYNLVTGWTWTFNGGTPSTSSVQNPVVTYNTPGIYEVTLQATDGSLSDTETKTGYIRVLPDSETLPFLEPFEQYSTLSGIEEWIVYNPDGNAEFEITNVGHLSGQSAKLANFNQPAGSVDELESAPVDLSGVTGSVTLSFRYSYRMRSSGNDEWLKVFVTSDCGDTWVQRKTLHGAILDPNVLSTAWTPSIYIQDWTTVHMTNVTNPYWVDNFRYKFRFESDGGNNFYLDNINIYQGAPSEALVELNELQSINGLSVYPNPTDDDLNIQFSLASAQAIVLNVQDISGKQVMTNLIQANAGSNLVMMDVNELSSGVYFLKIQTGNGEETIQFVVK